LRTREPLRYWDLVASDPLKFIGINVAIAPKGLETFPRLVNKVVNEPAQVLVIRPIAGGEAGELVLRRCSTFIFWELNDSSDC
jgi:hypothetical protein